MTEFKDFYYSIPYFTRWWMTITFVLGCLQRLSLVHGITLILDFPKLINEFQIWRPVTALFFIPFSMQFLFTLYFIYHYSGELENGWFAGKPAHYLYMLIFCWACSIVAALLFSFPLLIIIMTMAVVYVWSLLHKDRMVIFFFGLRFQAMYLPWAITAVHFISGGGGEELAGIVIGHLAYFLMFIYPQQYGGPELLKPPMFLQRMYPESRIMGSVRMLRPENPVRRPNTDALGDHQWGRGNVLGGH